MNVHSLVPKLKMDGDGDDQVKLFGYWPSPFVKRVVLALKLKGIEYEYVEEDIYNKSDLLLKYNPVYKKVPVLVHRGKSIAESLVILEYIEETWPDNYPLLPKDPCQRALARFWAKYTDDKAPTSIWSFLYLLSGEEHEMATKLSLEMLRTFEEHGLGEGNVLDGDTIGLVDLSFGVIAHWLTVIQDIVGVKVIGPDKFPRICAWLERFIEVPVIKDNLPNRDELVAALTTRREFLQQQHGTVVIEWFRSVVK